MRKMRWVTGFVGITLLLGLVAGIRWAAGQASGPGKPAEEAPLQGGIPFPTEPPAPNESEPRVFADSKGRVYRLWIQERAGDERGGVVRFTRSDDGGLSWLKPPLTLPDRGQGGRAISPGMAFDANGNLFAVWRTKFKAPNDRLVRFQRSSDAGATWEKESRDLNQKAAGFEPQISLGPNGHLYIAWSDERRGGRLFDVYFIRSRDQGKSWEQETRLTGVGPASGLAINFRPRLVHDATGRVYVTWIGIGNRGSSVFFRRSLDFGESWEETVNVSQGGSSTTNQTLLQTGTDGLVLLWHGIREGQLSIYASRSEDGGKSWDSPVELRHLAAGKVSVSVFPEVARGPKGEIYVVWQDNRNRREDIYLSRSLDGGKTWLEEEIRVDQDSPGTAVSRLPQIAVSPAGTVAVAWEDDRKGFPGIYLALSFNGGKSWREMRVDQNTPERTGAYAVQMAWGPAEVLHLVWEERKRLGVSELDTAVRYRRLAITPPSGS